MHFRKQYLQLANGKFNLFNYKFNVNFSLLSKFKSFDKFKNRKLMICCQQYHHFQ